MKLNKLLQNLNKMTEMENNSKPFSVADWSIMVNGILIILLLLIGCDDYRLRNKAAEVKPAIVLDNELVVFKKHNDSIIMVAETKKEVYSREINASKGRMKKNAEKNELLRDTITKTIDSSQFEITKRLCLNVKNERDFKEINYCLIDGKEAKDSLREVKIQLSAKDTIIGQQKIIIDRKDSVEVKLNTAIITYKEENTNLFLTVDKLKHQKKVWRRVAIGTISVIVATIAIVALF